MPGDPLRERGGLVDPVIGPRAPALPFERSAAGDGLENFRLVASDIDLAPILVELVDNEPLWLANSTRQQTITAQRDTQSIFLRNATASPRPDVDINDILDSGPTSLAARFPATMRFLTSCAQRLGGRVGRALFVRLKPRSQVLRHVDRGAYYRSHDRFHLVVVSPTGSILASGDERVTMRPGEFWWFDNKQPHEALNEGDAWRIHLIFDIRRRAAADAGAGQPAMLSPGGSAITTTAGASAVQAPNSYREDAMAKAGSAAPKPDEAGVRATAAATDPAHTGTLPAPTAEFPAIFGQIVMLMMVTPEHRHIFLSDLEWMVVPPVALQQYRFYRDNEGRLVAFAAWAFLSAEVEERINSGNPRLAPQDWKSGDRLWLVTVISPAAQAPAVLEDLRTGMLSRYRINYHRRSPDGKMIPQQVAGKDFAPAH